MMRLLLALIFTFFSCFGVYAAPHLGDYVEDETVHFIWHTNDSNGASITRATNGTVSVYKDNGVTQSTAGITDTEDFDSLTGIHVCTIDTSADAFYATGANYTVVLSAATIDSQTVNAVLAHFSIENRFDEVDITQVGGDAITDNGDGRLEVNVEEIADAAVSTSSAQLGVNVVNYGGSAASSTVAGHPDVNVTYWEDDAVPATTDGYPAVNVDEWDDTDVAAAVSGYPEVNVTHWEDSAITDADATPDVNTTTIEGGDATDAINTECDNAIVTYELDHLVYAAESDDPADNSIIAKLAASDGDWSGFDNSEDSLEALRDNQAAASDAVLMQNTTITVTDQTHFTLGAGSADDDAYNNMIVVLTDQVTAAQKSVRTVSDYTGSSRTVTIDSAPDFTIATGDTIDIIAVAPGTTPPTAAQIADAVWDEESTGHTDAGKAGEQLWTDIDAILVDTGDIETDLNDGVALTSATETQIDNIETDTAAYDTDAEYATAIWNAATTSYGGAGTYGQAVEDTVADTNELQSNQNWNVWDDVTRSLTELDEDNTTLDLNATTIGTVTTLTGHTAQTGDNYARLGAPAGASIAADIAAIEGQTDDIGVAGAGLTAIPWNSAWNTDVNAQVVDVLKTDTIAEMSQGAPPATPTFEEAINYLYKTWRNQNITDSTTIEIYDDAGTTVLYKSTISDDGTDFTKGEFASGP